MKATSINELNELMSDLGWVFSTQLNDNTFREFWQRYYSHKHSDVALLLRYIINDDVWVVDAYHQNADLFSDENYCLVNESFPGNRQAAIERFVDIARNIDSMLMEQAL